MNVLIVYAHPEPRSFNGAVKDIAVETLNAQGHTVVVSDLYAQGFDAIAGPRDVTERLDPERFNLGHEQAHAAKTDSFAPAVQAEIDKLLAADFLILQFPMWWFSLPAILKGWIDRVFAFGVTYDFGRTWDNGVFAGRRAMLSFTASAPAAAFLPDGKNGDMERVLWPIHAGVLALCGYQVLEPQIAHGIPFVGEKAMLELLDQYRERLRTIDGETAMFFHGSGDIDDDYRLKASVKPATPAQHRGQRVHMV